MRPTRSSLTLGLGGAAGALLAAAALSASCGNDDPAKPPPPPSPPPLALPGDAFYPESITATADGRVLVGSFGTGGVVTFAPGAASATTFLAGGGDVKRALGILADDRSGSLWLCADDDAAQNPRPPLLRRYDFATGAPLASYSFSAPAFCNDLALDGRHNLYVTDSRGTLYRLADGGSTLEPWCNDPLLAPSTPGGFGANGVTWDGASSLYVSVFSENRLVRIAIRDDGSAGPAATVGVTPALAGPDALRALDADTLLVVEQSGGRLTRVAVREGAATALATNLNMPTSVAVVGDRAWVTEGQLGHILGTVAGPPALPFALREVSLK